MKIDLIPDSHLASLDAILQVAHGQGPTMFGQDVPPSLDGLEGFFALADEDRMGFWLFRPLDPISVEGHPTFMKAGRGQHALDTSFAIFRRLFLETPVETVFTVIGDYPRMLEHALQMGFRPDRTLDNHNLYRMDVESHVASDPYWAKNADTFQDRMLDFALACGPKGERLYDRYAQILGWDCLHPRPDIPIMNDRQTQPTLGEV